MKMCVDFNEGVLELPVIQGHSITGQYHSSSSYCRAVTIDERRGIKNNLHNKRNE